MTIRLTLNNFNAGEVDDNSLGFRSDSPGYAAGLKRCENFLVTPQGPIVRRPGFRRIAVWDQARRLINFQFSVTQAYLFVLGNGKLRVFTADAQTAEIDIPWSDSELTEIKWAQTFDTLIVVHPSYQPRKIVRGGSHSSWTLSTIAFTYEPFFRYYSANPDLTLASSTNSDPTGVLTASAALFDSSWIGKRIKIGGGVCTITAITDSMNADITIQKSIIRRQATTDWTENAMDNSRGWPRSVGFHQNRLLFGGIASLPQTIFGSTVGDFFNFNNASNIPRDAGNVPIANSLATTTDRDSWTFTLSSSDVNAILDIVSIRDTLQIFTTSSEWVEASKPLTPTSVSFTRSTSVGSTSSGLRVLGIDSDSLLVSRDGKQVRAFAYNFDLNGFTAPNLTVINPTIINNPVDAAYARGLSGQANHALFANADGSVAALCIDTDQHVKGWSRFSFTDGAAVKNICSVVDSLYALIAWNSHRYVCKLDPTFYLDLSETATAGSPTKTWTGFTTFAGKTVSVVGDGYAFTNMAVDGSGNFALPTAVSSIVVGLPYTATAQTLTLSPVINGQQQRGRRLRKISCEVTLRDTADLWIDGKQVPARSLGTGLLNQPPAARDTTVRWLLAGIGRELTVMFESRLPLPCSILGTIIELKGPFGGD